VNILNFMAPKAFVLDNGVLCGMQFEKMAAHIDAAGQRSLQPTGEPDQFVPCDDVLVAVGQENSFPWIERDIGIAFDQRGMPVVDELTFQASLPKVFLEATRPSGPRTSSQRLPTAMRRRCRSTSSAMAKMCASGRRPWCTS
jgi:NADPH-dependent glutamate synthase beta subunit-like oxidoreductase